MIVDRNPESSFEEEEARYRNWIDTLDARGVEDLKADTDRRRTKVSNLIGNNLREMESMDKLNPNTTTMLISGGIGTVREAWHEVSRDTEVLEKELANLKRISSYVRERILADLDKK